MDFSEPSSCFPEQPLLPSALSLYLSVDTLSVDGWRISLGLFIVCGIVFSYLPQFAKITALKSSRGISPGFLVVGSIGGAASLANISLLQASLVKCCFTDVTNPTPRACLVTPLTTPRIRISGLPSCASKTPSASPKSASKFPASGSCKSPLLDICFDFLRSPAATVTDQNKKQTQLSLFLFITYFPRPDLISAENPSNNPTSPVSVIPILDEGDTEEPYSSHAADTAAYIRALQAVNIIILTIIAFALITAVTLYLPEWIVFVAGVFGVLSGLSSVFLFLPQIVQTVQIKSAGAVSITTLCMQVPGNFLFAFSIFLSPGANATSYVPLVITGLLQFVLLSLCLHYHRVSVAASAQEEREGLLN
ncbi:hypothetical protein HDU98_010092 [Podochytrium sp. JEL0797]|nr:hypothetical protein HDU98_010092 [Podochytrium sp. JEL0797]